MGNVILSKLMTIFIFLAGIIVLFMFLPNILTIIMPFLVAYLISSILYPFVSRINERNKKWSSLTTLIILLIFISFVSLLIYGLGSFLVSLLTQLGNSMPGIIDSTVAFLSMVTEAIDQIELNIPILKNVNLDLAQILSDTLQSLGTYVGQASTTIVSKIIQFVSFLPGILVFLIITLVSSFYMIKDRKMISAFIEPYRNRVTENKWYIEIKSKIFKVVWGYLRAQLILMSITFVIASIGLTFLGIKNSILIALGVALVDALPMFGPATVYVPWIIANIIVGQYTIGIGLGVIYLISTLTRQMMEPKIVSTQIGLYPLITLFSMYTGLKLIGVFGLILGPVTAIICRSILTIYTDNHKNTNIDDISP